MNYWAAVQTFPKQEARAVRNLHRQNFVCFYPFLLAGNRFGRQVVSAVFPSYIFVQLDSEKVWTPVRYTFGVRRLLMKTKHVDEEYDVPAKIPFVDNLRHLRLWQPEQRCDEPEAQIPIGTMVRVKRGPFAQRVGLVEMSAADRVRLLMDAFNRTCSVDFDVDSVEALAPAG
ncbi:MAG: hypothetical protein J2P48_06895 [Alphaproteobacteria bacterium]|nr:hypothetical protein [Alphaproteobacteria bacterium]